MEALSPAREVRPRAPIVILAASVCAALAGCARTPALSPLEQLEPLATHTLLGAAACHTQGIAILGDRLYASCADKEEERAFVRAYQLQAGFPDTSSELTLLAEVDVTVGDQWHPSGLAVGEGCVFVAAASYRASPATSDVICLDPLTLKDQGRFVVEDHIGTLGRLGERLVGINWDARQLYLWELDGTEVSVSDSPSDRAYQDCQGGDSNQLLCVAPEGSAAQVDALALDLALAWTATPLRRFEKSGQALFHSLGREGFKIHGERWLLAPDDFPDAKIYVFNAP